MKLQTLILAAMLLAAPAYARNIAYVENDAGGEIILTDDAGTCKDGGLRVLGRGGNSKVIFGCWIMDETATYILVQWQDGDFRMYPAEDFTIIPAPGTGA